MMNQDIIVASTLEDALKSFDAKEGYTILLHCLAGKLHVETELSQYTVTANDLLLCPPERLRGNYMQSPDFGCKVIAVRRHALDDLVYLCFREDNTWWEKAQHLQQHPVIHLNERQRELVELFERLFKLYAEDCYPESSEKVRRVFAEAAILELLGWLEKDIPATQSESKQGRQEVLFRNFVHLLQQDKGRHREVNWYADQLAITPKYLSFVCRKMSGKAASALINDMVVQEIKRCLYRTDLSTKEICGKMDFPSLSFFCKYVKQHLGMTANQYRHSSRDSCMKST